MDYRHCALWLVVACLALGCSRQDNARTTAPETVKRGPFNIVIQGRCELRSENESVVWIPSPPSRVRVRELKAIELAEEGSRVEKGDVVVVLDPSEVSQFIDKSEGELKVANAALESAEKTLAIEASKLQSEVKKSEVAVAQREIDWKFTQLSPSYKDRLDAYLAIKEAKLAADNKQSEVNAFSYLESKKVVSPFELEQKRLEYQDAVELCGDKELDFQVVQLGSNPIDMARTNTAWQKEKFNLEQQRNNLQHKMSGLKAELAKAKKRVYRPTKNLELANSFLERMKIRAPMGGIVLYRRIWSESGREKIKKGMRVWRGQAILSIQQNSDMKVVVEVPESQVPFLKLGNKATIDIDSLDDREFSGKVAEIESTAHDKGEEEEGGEEAQKEVSHEKVFSVKVKLDEQDARFKPGFRGTVKIFAHEYADVIAIPSRAMFRLDGKQFVYVQRQGQAVMQAVVPGVAFADKVVIDQGLDSGDQVFVEEPPASIRVVRQSKTSVPSPAGIEVVGIAETGALRQKLVETGFLQPQQAIELGTAINGELTEIVREGSYVKQGDKVFVLTVTMADDIEEIIQQQQTLETEIDKQQSELALARKNQELEVRKVQLDVEQVQFELTWLRQKPLPHEIKKAEIATRRAEFSLQIADKNLEISQALWQKQLVSEAELSQRKLQLETNKLLLEMARIKENILRKGPLPEEVKLLQERLELEKLKLAQTKKTAASVIEQFESAVTLAQARLAEQEYLLAVARESMQKGICYAPVSGVVRYVDEWNGKPEIGKECYEGQTLVTIADEANMVVKSKVNEVDRAAIHLDQTAQVQLPAFPRRQFSGRVTAVGQLAVDRNEVTRRGRRFSGVKVFEALVAISEQEPALKSGMSATVEIVVGEYPNVLIVPKHALFQDAEGAYLYVLKGDKADMRRVTPGPGNEVEVSIVKGLAAGETVCLPRR